MLAEQNLAINGGGFTSLPLNIRLVPQSEVIKYLVSYVWTRKHHVVEDPEQLATFPWIEGRKRMTLNIVTFSDGDAHYGIAIPNKPSYEKQEDVYYFAYGCDHKWQYLGETGRCIREYSCSTCGLKREIDSSD